MTTESTHNAFYDTISPCKRRLIRFIFASVGILIFFSSISIYRGFYLVGGVELLFSAIGMLIVFGLREHFSCRQGTVMFLAALSALLFFLMITGGVSGNAMMWILIYPIFVFLLDRDNTALAWNLYFVLLIVSVGVLSSFDLLPVSYTTFYIVMMLSAYLLVFTLTYIFRKDIEESKNELTQLNNDLEMRVRDEVGRSKEKDALLFEQSKQAQMGEMIAMIAHQWRQPLSAISSTAIAVETKIKLGTFDLDDPSQREAYESMIVDELEKIAMYTQHLSQTIDDFRNFFRPQKNASLTSTTQLVQRSISLLQGLLNNKGVDVELELCEERELHTHVNELIQVLVNIIKNSVDNFEVTATDAPHLLVTTSEEHGQCSIKICDNGGGIAVDAMERIFEPYFSTKSDKNGTGLGLYMSRIIVEDHCQGTLRAYNSQEGACFVVTVPTDHENVQKES